MTQTEMRELDEWIRNNVPGVASNANPTRDPAAALDVLKKCAEETIVECIRLANGNWFVSSSAKSKHRGTEAETLELAIAKFSQKLFTT